MNASLNESIINPLTQNYELEIVIKQAQEKKATPSIERENFNDLVTRSKFEIHKHLKTLLQTIEKEISAKLSYKNILIITSKNYINEVKRTPLLLTICKIGVVAFFAYSEKNFFEGIIAGEVLLKNTPFNDLFSSDVSVQNNAGGAITNAVQDAQFARDGIFTLGTLYYVLFRNSYRKARHDIIEECFNKYLNDETLPIDISNELFALKKEEHDKSWL